MSVYLINDSDGTIISPKSSFKHPLARKASGERRESSLRVKDIAEYFGMTVRQINYHFYDPRGKLKDIKPDFFTNRGGNRKAAQYSISTVRRMAEVLGIDFVYP